MPTIQFNDASFRAVFCEFANTAVFTPERLTLNWDMATQYVTKYYGGCWPANWTLAQQTLALNLMTAHLTQLFANIATGDTSGIVTQATIDKISVTIQPPPELNQWQWWLNQTPYGQQLLALLQQIASGGWYFPGAGVPVAPAFRR